MLHARGEGETFGLACAEFLINRKPIITWGQSRERNHVLIGGQSTIFYNHENDLTSILEYLNHDFINMKKELIPIGHLEMYSPLKVLPKLKSYLGIQS